MSFKDELKVKKLSAEEKIYAYLPEEKGFPKKAISAMNYSMEAGGKRIRPILLDEAAKLFGKETKAVPCFMAAIEMIHTHSLIHDDLPAIDNDEYRRGKLTTHAVYGESMAILSGDALLNYAYETAMRAFEEAEDREDYVRIAKALQILAKKTGVYGMLGGQTVDVENEKNDVMKLSGEELDFIYLHKTAALLEAPLMIGGILGGADDDSIEQLEQIGRKIGLAFQIQDDILDVTSTTEILGKPVNSDEKNDKTTYVTLYGVEEAGRIVHNYTEEAVALLQNMPGDTGFLEQLLTYMAVRQA